MISLSDLPTQLQQKLLEERFAKRQDEEGSERHEVQVTPLAELERQAILGAIRTLNGDKLKAAKLLGIGKTTLYRKLKEYGIADSLHDE